MSSHQDLAQAVLTGLRLENVWQKSAEFNFFSPPHPINRGLLGLQFAVLRESAEFGLYSLSAVDKGSSPVLKNSSISPA